MFTNPGLSASERHGSHDAVRAVAQAGRKVAQWKKDLAALEKEAVLNGVFEWKEFDIDGKHYRKRMGTCLDCTKYKHLTPDHLIKRSQGGDNSSGNIQWVCWTCHDLRDNKGDPMNKKPPTNKNVSWKVRHACKNCKKLVLGLLCPFCHELSL